MKLGFIVKSQDNIEKWAQFADGVGIPGIEIDYMHGGPYEFDTKTIKAAFEPCDSSVCAMSMWHINTIAADPEERKAADAQIEAFLRATAEVGAPIAFMNTGTCEEGNTARNIEEFAKQHDKYAAMAADLGLQLAFYLGHKGNFVNSKEILTEVTQAVPSMKLKLDPVGLERNSHADPYEILSLFGEKIIHFHCKDVTRYKGFEIEPPVGMGDIRWNIIIGMLYHFGYDGYVVIEPHGPLWGSSETMAGHIKLSKRHLEQFIL